MKDLPVFTTEYGAASLVLREIPYQGVAYVRLQDSLEPEKLLKECVSFCRMVGADRIIATGNEILESLPFHTAIWQMTCPREALPDTDAALWPVTPETADRFRKIYNEKVKTIPNAAWMDDKDQKEMIASGEGYFVHRAGRLLGIGRVCGEELRFLAAIQPGAGETVVKTLAQATTGDRVLVEVASANRKAVRLYEKLGFLKIKELSAWHRVL